MLHMTMMPLIEQLRVRLEEARAGFQERHPQVRLKVYEYQVGTSPHLGYQISLEAFFPDRPSHQADNLGLAIWFERLETAPHFNADVVWDDPSGYLEAEWQGPPVPWSLAAGSQLLADLPRLIQVFAEAVDRGYPSRP